MLEVSPPSGPFAVGQCDCMWRSAEVADSNQGSEVGGETGVLAHKLMVRIYYPVDKEAARFCAPGAWLPDSHGGGSYAEAYAKALFKPGVNSALVGTLGFVPLMSNVTTQTVVDAPLIGPDKVPKLPPVVYSHGMLGNRTCYSFPCIDLASYGFIVFAVEHADGSACLNCYPDKTVVPFKHAPRSAVIPGKHVRIKNGFGRSLVPENLPKDSTQHDLRNAQLRQRIREVSFIADCIEWLDSGSNPDYVSVPSTLAEFGLRSRLDLARLACMGHSFGALTSICTSTADARFKACIAHDVWLFPAGQDMVEAYPRVPTLFLNASTFDMLWPVWGRKVLARWIARARRAGVDIRALHVKGCKHQNFADFPVLIPEISQTLGFAGETPPAVINKILVDCDYEFFCHHLGIQPFSEARHTGATSDDGRTPEASHTGTARDLDGEACEADAAQDTATGGWGGSSVGSGLAARVGASWLQQLGDSVASLGFNVSGPREDSVTNGWKVPVGLEGVELDKCHTLTAASASERIPVGHFTYQLSPRSLSAELAKSSLATVAASQKEEYDAGILSGEDTAGLEEAAEDATASLSRQAGYLADGLRR